MNKQVQSIPAQIARSEPAPTLAERLRHRARQAKPGRFCRLPSACTRIPSAAMKAAEQNRTVNFWLGCAAYAGSVPTGSCRGKGRIVERKALRPSSCTESGPAADKVEAGPAVMFVPVTGLAHMRHRGWRCNPSPLALSVSVPPHYSRQGDMLAVIAVGNSMRIPDGIREGYVVMCDCGREPARDDAVFVEKLNGSASIKRYVDRDEEWLYLQGWLKPNERGEQLPYSDQLRLDSIKRMAPVVFVQRRGRAFRNRGSMRVGASGASLPSWSLRARKPSVV